MVTIAPTHRPGVPGHRCCNWNALGSICNSSVPVVRHSAEATHISCDFFKTRSPCFLKLL